MNIGEYEPKTSHNSLVGLIQTLSKVRKNVDRRT
jgi:hypothetical protein